MSDIVEKLKQLGETCCYDDPTLGPSAAAEINRLRKDVIHWREARRSCIEAYEHQGDTMKAEVERLRDKLVEYMNETQTKAAEIERLREISRPGSCECSTEDACRFARERDEARAEIERLRELLERVGNELGRENEGLVQMINEALGK